MNAAGLSLILLCGPVTDDGPPVLVTDLDRFPSQAVCTVMREWSKEYRERLQRDFEFARDAYPFLGSYEPILDELADAKHRYFCWDKLDDAWHAKPRSDDRTLANLRTLRDRIGYEAYYSGTMPTIVDLRYLKWKE
jgi:hypothetical protein